MKKQQIKTKRNINAVLIPTAVEITIPKDSEVTIVQSLGGNYTVNVNGNLARVNSEDADALGFKEQPQQESQTASGSLEDKIKDKLQNVYDPEIPIDIYNLGLVYGFDIKELENDKHKVKLRLTLTAPGCSMGPIIAEDARQQVLSLAEVDEVEIEFVFDPPWDKNRMTDAAKLALDLL